LLKVSFKDSANLGFASTSSAREIEYFGSHSCKEFLTMRAKISENWLAAVEGKQKMNVL